MAGRLLLRHLAGASGLDYHGIEKDGFKNHHHHISLSTLILTWPPSLALPAPVGIDVSSPKKTAAHRARILDKTELENAGANITKHCIYWCAKGRNKYMAGLLFTHHLRATL